MGIRTMWQVHEHITNKSFAKVMQWLVEMKPTLGREFTLYSLHSHDKIWEEATILLPIIYSRPPYGDYIEMTLCPRIPKYP
jgi:hypothetical protein